MNKHVKRKWLKALRSGKYKKGAYKLGKIYPDADPQFCCLGILVCEMAPEFARIEGTGVAVGEDFNKFSYLPDDLAIIWGVGYDEQRILGRINDESMDFERVVSFIEVHL